MGTSSRFWNVIARRYASMPVRDDAAYREKLRLTQSRLRPDWKVLEFGCGTGTTALEHAPHVAHIRAIDSSKKMIEICREKAASAGIANVTFEVADIDALNVAPGEYDAVLGMSILHLLDDWNGTVGKVYGMLRPGGIFVSSTTCLEGQAQFFQRFILPVGNGLGILPKLQAFSRGTLRHSLQAAGFEIDHEWQPDDNPAKAVFIIARKPEQPSA